MRSLINLSGTWILFLAACAAPAGGSGYDDFGPTDDAGGANHDGSSDKDANIPMPAAPSIVSLGLSAPQVAVGATVDLTVTFSAAWTGAQPLPVQFVGDPTVRLPTGVTLAFNQDKLSVKVAGVSVGAATITATTASDAVGKSTSLQVVPAVMSVAPSPLKMQSGTTAMVTVTLSGPALQGDQTISLSSGDPRVVTVQQSVTVPQGATSVTFPASALVQGGPVQIAASLAGSSQSTEVLSITPVDRLVLSEVLYDPIGTDDNFEWVELYNGGAAAVDLSQYFLATTWSSNSPNYVAATPALRGMLPAGGCIVIGGPSASPSTNSLPANFVFDVPVPFSPTLPNNTDLTGMPLKAMNSHGVALVKGTPPSGQNPVNPGTTPLIDALIYGNSLRGILDETGMQGALDVDYAMAGKSLERVGPDAWRQQSSPNGRVCDWLHL